MQTASMINKSVKNLNTSPSKKLKIMRVKRRDGSNNSRRSADRGEKENIESQASSTFMSNFNRPPSARSRATVDGGVHQADLSGAVNIQEKLFEIIENEDVGDVVDLNEKFLSRQLGGIDQAELALLPKIELRVDTNFYNLQVTGEILTSLEYLKMNDSVISSFRDLGTSFKNVRVLYLGRSGLKDIQGI